MGRYFHEIAQRKSFFVQEAVYIQESHWSWGKTSCQASGRVVSIGTHVLDIWQLAFASVSFTAIATPKATKACPGYFS